MQKGPGGAVCLANTPTGPNRVSGPVTNGNITAEAVTPQRSEA